MLGKLEEYPNLKGYIIYETNWELDGEIFYYIGSHKYRSKNDRYIGSNHFFRKEVENPQITFNRKNLQETTNENRLIDEEKWIKIYKEKYKDHCINLNLHPSQAFGSCGILWSSERRISFNNTCQEKFGGHPFQAKKVKEKIKKTLKKRYGVEHHLQRDDILQKQKETNIKKYGVDNISKLDEIKKKKKETHIKNGKPWFSKEAIEKGRALCNSPEAIQKRREKLLSAKRKYYTNGIKNLLIAEGEQIPNGFYKGRFTPWMYK